MMARCGQDRLAGESTTSDGPGRGGAELAESDSLGLESGTVVIVPYDPRWVDLFEQASTEIRQACGSEVLDVEHVGSTSVTGLCAKPVLDIMATVPELVGAVRLVPTLERLGYEFRPGNAIRDRHFFRRRRGTARTHHLALTERSSHYRRVTLAFRDALRGDSQLAAEYADLKLRLAREYSDDRPAYIEAKTAFVERVLAGGLG
jgi:GrpB-like predicted nucleotidyltransferase (UPF0157 family)